MKRAKITGLMGAAALAVAATFTMWTGTAAQADTGFGEIRPVFSAYGTWPFSSDECVALDANDGFYANNARVFQWNCNGHDDQQWSLHLYEAGSFAGNLYQIINKQSGKCMEVSNSSNTNGVGVDQYTCQIGGGDLLNQQLWTATPSGNGGYYLQPFSSLVVIGQSKCLDVRGADNSDGTMIEQWTCNGGTNQQFYLFGGNPPTS